MNQRRIAGRGVQLNGVVGSNSAPAAPAPVAQFEAAKAASAQRAATSISAADAAVGIRDDASVRRAGNVTFVLRDGVWTDVRYKGTGTVLRVKPYSEAYFKLLDIEPDLREAFSIGESAIVTGKNMAIELTPSGEERLTDRDIALLKDRW